MKNREIEQPHDGTRPFSSLDVHFAAFLARLAGGNQPDLKLAAALLSSRTAAGHTCLDLAEQAGRPLLQTGLDETAPVIPAEIVCPPLEDWVAGLLSCDVVGRPTELRPLILDSRGRLYLHRYWEYEKTVADFIRARTQTLAACPDHAELSRALNLLFPASSPRAEEPDRQRTAAIAALLKPFCVITGGPGTGKTTTVAKILALLAEFVGRRILLAAPTGKAAARLQHAVIKAKKDLQLPESIKKNIPEVAATLHRLLQPIAGSPFFRFNRENPLPADAVVVDEASMIDLPLMAKLMQAIPPAARLVLVGDRHQLASVAPGAVLADICHPEGVRTFSKEFNRLLTGLTATDLALAEDPTILFTNEDGLHDSVVELRRNYRFIDGCGIMELGSAINKSDNEKVSMVLANDLFPDVSFRSITAPHFHQLLVRRFIDAAGDSLPLKTPDQFLSSFARFRILCAVRKGPFGVEKINHTLEQFLAEQGILSEKDASGPEGNQYHGRPIIINKNDYDLHLYNGDVGIVLSDPEAGGRLRAFFPLAEGGFRRIPVARLPAHETVFALTVHKSQGSEFDRILLVLPDKPLPVLTRELVYTAVTRAKKSVEIWGTAEVLQIAISQEVRRHSGLQESLWPGFYGQ